MQYSIHNFNDAFLMVYNYEKKKKIGQKKWEPKKKERRKERKKEKGNTHKMHTRGKIISIDLII